MSFALALSAENRMLMAAGEVPLHSGLHLELIHKFFMVAYLLITNVLLINLLIATFR